MLCPEGWLCCFGASSRKSSVGCWPWGSWMLVPSRLSCVPFARLGASVWYIGGGIDEGGCESGGFFVGGELLVLPFAVVL
jgi:hypothetical protein